MRSTAMKHEGVAFSLEYKSQVQTAATFHEGWDSPKSNSGV
jgi:hypothetical protein